jgi:subtilisin family serine protease
MVDPRRISALVAVIVLSLSTGLPAQSGGDREKVLIRAPKPYTQIVARVRAAGGTVSHEYIYIDAIAAEVPVGALGTLRDLLGPAAISKDAEIPLPASKDTPQRKQLPGAPQPGEALADDLQALDAAQIAMLASANPEAYTLNNSLAGLDPLFAAGYQGNGIVVGLIDSGIRPGFPHIAGSVIGCEDFVGDALGCSNFGNNGHGTFVAGMIASHVAFLFSPSSTLAKAVHAYCPSCSFPFPPNPALTEIPMIGTAPGASLYALRVFGATGGSPSSRILAAMDRVIALKDAGTVAFKVVNMSLGGATVFPGGDLEDQMVDVMLAHDIVPVIAAGNAGQASLTIGSPGSAFGALTVGAANLSHNERILRDLQFGTGIGALYRPSDGHQTAYFSSRGPNADGRPDPDVVMNGFASFGMGLGSTTSSISIASGTSFATPSTSGVAAVLRQAFPSATARQIRNAIVAGANPNFLADGSTAIDQGAGFVNAAASRGLLAAGLASDSLAPPPHATQNVDVNVQQNTFLRVRNGSVSETASLLKPGERHEIVYNVTPNTKQVIVGLANVVTIPTAQQNQLFGDDILLTVHSAKTSSIGEGDYKFFEFTKGGLFVVDNPETGLMRITVSGDWTNAGPVSADVSIFSTTEAIPQLSTQGKLADQQLLQFPLVIPAGVANAEFRLGWREDWGTYPSADVDLILISPGGAVNLDGATLNNPEVATVTTPQPGTWIVLVDGFNIPAGSDKFELRVSLDGKVRQIR